MKDILKEYGPAVIAVVATALVLVILFQKVSYGGKTGLLNILGTAAVLPEQSDISGADDAYLRNPPEAKAKEISVTAGTAYAYMDLLEITDADGQAISEAEVMDVTDGGGGSCPGCYDADTKTLTFPSPGVYRLHLGVVDELGASARPWVNIRVKRGGN